MRVAVTGARGRLGRALAAALGGTSPAGPSGPIAWSRPELDLDTLSAESVAALLERDRPDLVVHAAAWTDVDGCAREPDLAMRRNGTAAGEIARACARRGVDLLVVSSNEVFDGRRTDGRGYRPDEPVSPINPYGAAKAAAERLAAEALAGSRARLAIVRTAWLFGPPGGDFPAKIAAAALRARASGEPLRVTGDEVGTPTYAPDLAGAIASLLGTGSPRLPGSVTVHHLVNGGRASRADWAREVLRALGIGVEVVEVPAAAWARASSPPLWAVLEPTPLPSGAPMRHWRDALAEAVPELARALPR